MTDAEISAALAGLASASLATRDASAHALEASGWPAALRLLRTSRDLPPTARARALFTFVALTYAEQARRIRRDPPGHTLTISGAAPQLARAIAGTCGLEIHCDPALRERHGALDLKDAPSLQVLDALAAAAGGRWSQDDFGAVTLRPEPEPVYPAVYPGDLRLRVVRVATQRDEEFTGGAPRLTASVRVEVQLERPLQPLMDLSLRCEGAVDDEGNAPQVELARRAGDETRGTWDCVLVGLSPHARTLAELRLVVTAMFPDTHEVLAIERPAAGVSVLAELCGFIVTGVGADGLTLVTRRRSDVPPVPKGLLIRAIDAAFLGISDEAEEIASVQIASGEAEDDELRWHLRWSTLDPTRLTQLRVRVARTLYMRATPCALTGLALP
jgi:hypothetical protein